jgi:serine/threonine protein phosphatase PrpC
MAMKIRLTGKTDVGLQRELNEDSFGIVEALSLVVVCDGMGGHAAGEIASRSAVDTIIRLHTGSGPPSGTETAFELPGDFSPEGKFLASSVRVANTRIYKNAQSKVDLSGMGTTIVAAILHHDRISICHVGDSRAYRVKNGVLQQLTEDHSWVNELIAAGQLSRDEAREFPNRNVITRALGVREKVKVDLREEKVYSGDIFLLCSDGLVSCLPDEDILEIVTAGGDDLDKIAGDLIAGANSGGGDDNITCVLMQVAEPGEPSDDDSGFVAFTFPEESDSELQAQQVVGDFLEATYVAARPIPGDDDITDEFEAEQPKSRPFLRLFAIILVIIAIIYLAYAFDIGGATEVISDWLGLG